MNSHSNELPFNPLRIELCFENSVKDSLKKIEREGERGETNWLIDVLSRICVYMWTKNHLLQYNAARSSTYGVWKQSTPSNTLQWVSEKRNVKINNNIPHRSHDYSLIATTTASFSSKSTSWQLTRIFTDCVFRHFTIQLPLFLFWFCLFCVYILC